MCRLWWETGNTKLQLQHVWQERHWKWARMCLLVKICRIMWEGKHVNKLRIWRRRLCLFRGQVHVFSAVWTALLFPTGGVCVTPRCSGQQNNSLQNIFVQIWSFIYGCFVSLILKTRLVNWSKLFWDQFKVSINQAVILRCYGLPEVSQVSQRVEVEWFWWFYGSPVAVDVVWTAGDPRLLQEHLDGSCSRRERL